MSNFSDAIETLLHDEGGYAPEDNGRGPVNMGITQATLDAFWKQEPAKCQALGLPRQVEALTAALSTAFYRAFFWDAYSFGLLASQRVAEILFSLAVNQGPGWAMRHAKRALAAAGLSAEGAAGVAVALNGLGENTAIAEIFASAMERYRDLAAKNPSRYADDLPGWERRLRNLCGIT